MQWIADFTIIITLERSLRSLFGGVIDGKNVRVLLDRCFIFMKKKGG